MADTFIQVPTDGSGKKLDTRTEGTNSEHRQVMVIGDPATNAGVAPVDATNGLKVDAATVVSSLTDKSQFAKVTDGTETWAIDTHNSGVVTLVDSSGNAVTFNANGPALPASCAPVTAVSGAVEYETVAASQTNQALGATGGTGDYLEGLVCVVSTAATSQVQIKDGAGSAITVLPNAVGAGVGTYYVPLGLVSGSGAWQITTAAGVAVIAIGNFT